MTTRSELESARAAVRCGVPAGSRVLCAVSGGLDSMCLLHFMSTCGREGDFSVTAAHFNHQLRGAASDGDEAFVRAYCTERGIPCVCGCGDVRAAAEREGLSVEEAGRKLRYAFLKETAAEQGCAVVLTAHHADDNAETVLLNLVRGTGVRGLAGIPPERDGILRPFLEISRAELADYAAAHGVPHVEDDTNADPDAAARNLLRLKVLPLLREVNPRAVEHMAAAARHLREADDFLESEAGQFLARARTGSGSAELTYSAWREIPIALRPRVLLGLFDLLGVGRKDVGQTHLSALEALVGEDGGQLDLPHGVTARYGAGRLVLERPGQKPGMVPLAAGRPVSWGAYQLTLRAARGGRGLALREAEGGEDPAVFAGPASPGGRLTLPGTHGGARTVKRLFLDRGISLEERESLPALYAGGRLAAVWPLGVDAAFLPEGDGPCRFIQIIKRTEENRT
jgi:tRNA(Ile)-lysidine synthase